MPIEALSDRDELRRFLIKDRLANAYLLGNLDPAYFQFCDWYGARGEQGEISNLVLLYTGLSLPVVFMSGGGEGMERFLGELEAVLPERFHFHVVEEQMEAVREVFDLSEASRMIRMGLDEASFQSPEFDDRVERLGHRDTAAIMELYEHYPDNFFEPHQLETGFYYGIRDGDKIISMGGVHVVSEEYDVALLGNLVTDRAHRGQGLATAITGRLIDELFDQVSLLALNVGEDNEPAVRLYRSMGFEANNIFYEGRREAPGAM